MTAIAASSDFISTCAGVGGGWRRIVKINISAGDDCPGEWRKATHSGVIFCRAAGHDCRAHPGEWKKTTIMIRSDSFCRVASDGDFTCSSANFSTNGRSYQRVCGRARGYQKGDPGAFYGSHTDYNRTIDQDYLSGLSITYSSNPRQHIWSFVSGRGERYNDLWSCPCSVHGGNSPPSFVGSDYYCESGSRYCCSPYTYYFNDTLWDGAGCIDNCCDNTKQPWFYRQLSQTTQDNIEARICAVGPFSQRSTLIDQLELYIQ